jgi:membrane protein YdbS with pleckstrin-like domain
MSAVAMPEPDDTGTDSPQGAAPVEPAPASPVASSAPAEASVPSIADGVERPLDPRSIALNRIVGWIVTAVISSGLLMGLLIVLVAVPLAWIKVLVALFWAAVTALLAWSAHFWPPLEHRYASYKVDEQGIEIRRGVVWRVVTDVPRSRVQHTDVSQGPLERSHGLGTLVIYTAGTDHARVDLSGLDHATALRIRDHLLPLEGDDAV